MESEFFKYLRENKCLSSNAQYQILFTSFFSSEPTVQAIGWETYYVSAAKIDRLILSVETFAVCCENRTKHTDILCGQNSEFWYVKASGTYRTTDLKDY
jgi:hypothetical protein